MFATIKGNDFFKATLTIFNGVVLGQTFVIVGTIFLAKLYGPNSFVTLAIYSSIYFLLVNVACGRYDIAISASKGIAEQNRLLIISILFSFIYAFLIFLLLVFLRFLINLNNLPIVFDYFFLMPVSIFFGGILLALQGYANRRGLYKRVSQVRVIQSLTLIAVPLIYSFFKISDFSLLLGQALSVTISSLILIFTIFAKPLIFFKNNFNLNELIRTGIRYKQFPIYSSAESLLNSSSSNIPILLLSTLFISPTIGIFFLVYRLLNGPLQMLSSSVGQVYLSKAQKLHENNGLRKLTIRLASILLSIGFILIVIIYFLSKLYASSFLGDDWTGIAEMILVLSPWFIMQIAVSPISNVLNIIGMTKIMTILSAYGTISRIGAVIGCYFLQATNPILYLSIFSCLYYIVCLVTFLYYLNKDR